MRLCIYILASSSFSTPVYGLSKVSLQNQGGQKAGPLARDDSVVREEYSPSGSFQSQLVAELPYPHILLCKIFVADMTTAFEIRLSPARSRCVPVIGAESSIIRATGALYIPSRVEVRSDWWRIFDARDRCKKTTAFIRWLHGVQRIRIDERGDQGYRHPPCGVSERIVTNGEDNELKRAKILAELGL